MKKILAFLLTTALILSMVPTVFAVKGGDGGFEGDVAYAFDSQEAINSIEYFKTKLVVDSSVTKSYPVSARYTVPDGDTVTQFRLTDNAVKAFNNPDNKYVNMLIYNAQSTSAKVYVYVTYNVSNATTLAPGWNTISVTKDSCFYSGTASTVTTGGGLTIGESSPVAGNVYYIDTIWLSENKAGYYSYDFDSDSKEMWQFNEVSAITDASLYAAQDVKFTADTTNVNAYNISAKYTTNTRRRVQLKLKDNTLQEKDGDAWKYNYVNVLICNPSSTEVTFGCGVSGSSQVTLPVGWSVASFEIDKLFLVGNNTYKRGGSNYANGLTGTAFNLSEQPGGNNPQTNGIVYNIDMIWASKTPAAIGTADANGSIVSQITLTCTDAVINSDGMASCKITNWPGERFVVIFATYNADGSLNSINCVRDYDGDENKETVVNSTNALTVPEGGTTKVMVWNGFGEIAPMTTVK